MTIGVLAFQGDCSEHAEALKACKVNTKFVRNKADLQGISGLIIPGGESTVIGKFLSETGLLGELQQMHRSEGFPLFGTCAGVILLASRTSDEDIHSLSLMDITIDRNAYGTQRESFQDTLQLNLDGTASEVTGTFIRAPRIVSVGGDVEVLATFKDDPVLVQQGTLLASTFHPELTVSRYLHQHFVQMCGIHL